MSLLKVEHVSKVYTNNIAALQSVSFQIGKGEVVGIVGESGSGKSTLTKLILGLETYKQGRITFNEQQIPPKKRSDVRTYRKNIQMVFQDSSSALNPKLPIGKSLLEPLNNFKNFTPSFFPPGKYTNREKAERLLEMVGLDKDMVDRYPGELSGGQKQRVCIARAISIEPALLVCDEATASLDVSVQVHIIELLKTLQRTLRMSILFISHDIRAVTNLCDTILVMKKGCLVDNFQLSDLFAPERHSYTKTLLQAAML
ncbi:ABC transporter ATP-binding protein [Robertmurraya sp. P23]|uniref:ABC transporter ATP-binding protein n=1 Tax=Robertmurraya sp. P23 TaxID=3436931 RepID=UPI003D974579